jgi:hypothetical protein
MNNESAPGIPSATALPRYQPETGGLAVAVPRKR